jgi:hypothetical protein
MPVSLYCGPSAHEKGVLLPWQLATLSGVLTKWQRTVSERLCQKGATSPQQSQAYQNTRSKCSHQVIHMNIHHLGYRPIIRSFGSDSRIPVVILSMNRFTCPLCDCIRARNATHSRWAYRRRGKMMVLAVTPRQIPLDSQKSYSPRQRELRGRLYGKIRYKRY